MPRFVVMKRGGQPGKVAINPDLVTEIRSSAGPFTDVYCGEHLVAVEGSFEQTIAALSGSDLRPTGSWDKKLVR